MDPHANIQEQVTTARAIIQRADDGFTTDSAEAIRLAELVIALDEWMTSGGFSPYGKATP